MKVIKLIYRIRVPKILRANVGFEKAISNSHVAV